MIKGIMLVSDEQEVQEIYQCLSDLTAHYTEERLEMQRFQESEPLLKQIQKVSFLDAAVLDVTIPGAIEAARIIRKQFEKVEILIVADSSVSPVQYMCPAIRACALLLRPRNKEWEGMLREFYEQLYAVQEKKKPADIIWIKNREGTFRISQDQICYLEAREKKVFIRTRREEFAMNGTIEKCMEQLPENFVRCHRSFVVNMNHITKIRLMENLLYLGENLFVPVSRSYKERFKGVKNDEGKGKNI